eukprot:UN21922
MFFYQRQQKLTNLKRVTPMLFYQKIFKFDKFEKGARSAFYKKTAKISKWGLTKLSKKQGGSSGMKTPDLGNHSNQTSTVIWNMLSLFV